MSGTYINVLSDPVTCGFRCRPLRPHRGRWWCSAGSGTLARAREQAGRGWPGEGWVLGGPRASRARWHPKAEESAVGVHGRKIWVSSEPARPPNQESRESTSCGGSETRRRLRCRLGRQQTAGCGHLQTGIHTRSSAWCRCYKASGHCTMGLGVSGGPWSRSRWVMVTFCFRRLHDSQACAVRIRLSSGTLGLVMVGERAEK